MIGRWSTVIGLSTAVLALGGCLVLPGVPEGFTAACEVDADCTGEGQVCLPAGTCGVEPPPPPAASLIGSDVSPAVAGRTTTVTVTLELDGELGGPPRVELDAGNGLFIPLQPVATTGESEGAPAFTYVPVGTESEGDRALRAFLTNADGTTSDAIAVGTVRLDFTAPALTSSELGPERLGPGDDAALVVAFDEEVVAPVAALISDDGETLPLVLDEVEPTDDEPRYHFVLNSDGFGGDGLFTAEVTAADPVGNSTTSAVGGLTRDTQPPVATVSTIILVSEPGNVIVAPTALREGGGARVVVIFDEPATRVGEPRVACGDAEVTAAHTVTDGNPLIVDVTLSSVPGGVEQDCVWSVTVVDDADNEVEVTLGTLPIDTLAPEPALLDMNALRHVRYPWGADETGGEPRHLLLPDGSDATVPVDLPLTVVSDAAQVAALEVASDGNVLLARVEATSDGFAAPALAGADSTSLFVTLLDGAGNRSSPVQVRKVSWVATLAGKVAGSNIANPHELRYHRTYLGAPLSSLSQELGPEQVLDQTDELTYLGGAPLAFDRLYEQAPSIISSVAIDPLRNRWFTADVAGLWERGQGNWSLITDSLPGNADLMRLTYNPVRDALTTTLLNIGFMYNGATWSQFGNELMNTVYLPAVVVPEMGELISVCDAAFACATTLHTTVGLAPSVSTFPSPELEHRFEFSLAAGGSQGDAILFGGFRLTPCTGEDAGAYQGEGFCSVADTWRFDGETWEELSPATRPPPRIAGRMVYDAAQDRVVLVGGIADRSLRSTLAQCPQLPGVVLVGDACLFEDAWVLEDGAWRELSGAPAAAYAGAIAYDHARQQVTVLGGQLGISDTLVEDVWTLRDDAFTKQPRAGDVPELSSNPGRFALTRHPPTGHVVFLNQDGEQWTWTGEQWLASPVPSPRLGCDGPLIYEPATEALVYVDTCTLPVRTWRLSLPDNQWTEVLGAAPSGNGAGATAAWHEPFGGVVLYGGASTDTWWLGGDNWFQRGDVAPGELAVLYEGATDKNGTIMRYAVESPGGAAHLYRLQPQPFGPYNWAWVEDPADLSMTEQQLFSRFRTTEQGDPMVVHLGSVSTLVDGAWRLSTVAGTFINHTDLVPLDDGAYLYLSAEVGNTIAGLVRPAAEANPAFTTRFRFQSAGGPDPRACLTGDCLIDRVGVRWVTGPEHDTDNPAQLSLYDPGGSSILGGGTGDLSFVIDHSDPLRLGRIFVGDERELIVTGAATEGRAPDLSPALVDVDYVEVRVDYRLPEQSEAP